ncbi:MAG: hypothetical protein WAT39_11335 [Planctomycetota bacterium]
MNPTIAALSCRPGKVGFRVAARVCAMVLLTHLSFAASTAAQCVNQWQAGDGVRGVDGRVDAAAVWDPDGSGPLPGRLVIGGDFQVVGMTAAAGIAWQDPATGTWSGFGAGIGAVTALAVLPGGELIAASNTVARWNGSSWVSFGLTNAAVNALAVLPNGDLVAGGRFVVIGGVFANNVARWNGATWVPLGSGTSDFVNALEVLGNGDLLVGGYFQQAGGTPAQNVARWNGGTWAALAGGVNGQVFALAELDNGEVVVGGRFTLAGGLPCSALARWNGTAWSSIGGGLGAWSYPTANSLLSLPNASFVVGGRFETAGGMNVNGVARWSGSGWSSFAGGMATPNDNDARTLTLMPGGDLVVGGAFQQIGSEAAVNVARWNGAWSALASGFNYQVLSVLALPDGDLVVGGSFRATGSGPADFVARGNGSTWQAMGNPGAPISDLVLLPGGDIAGLSTGVVRWNGTAWQQLGSGVSGYALTALPNGDLVVGGEFFTAAGNCVSRWNGTNWVPMGTGMTNIGADYVAALATLPDGDVVAGGSFQSAGGVSAANIARWNGSAWSAIGTGLPYAVNAIVVMPNGDLVVASGLPSGSARWNGVSWSPLASIAPLGSSMRALTVLPTGDLVVAGSFTSIGGVAANRIARWNGTTWSPLGAGVDDMAWALAALPSGGVAVAGAFVFAGGQVSMGVARHGTSCPAGAIVTGAGCAGAGGPHVLVADTLPLLGSTLRTTGSQLPGNALVVVATGFSPQVPATPLAALLPAGQPGCNLHVVVLTSDVLLTGSGTATATLALPNLPTFAGQSLYQQMLPVVIHPSLGLQAITATNALQLVLGVY